MYLLRFHFSVTRFKIYKVIAQSNAIKSQVPSAACSWQNPMRWMKIYVKHPQLRNINPINDWQSSHRLGAGGLIGFECELWLWTGHNFMFSRSVLNIFHFIHQKHDGCPEETNIPFSVYLSTETLTIINY